MKISGKMWSIIGVLLSVIGLVITLISMNDSKNITGSQIIVGNKNTQIQENQSATNQNIKGDCNLQIKGSNNNVGTVNCLEDSKNKEKINFKKFVPKTYLDNLPKIKYNTYIKAHEYWDTGATPDMLKGSDILSNKLRDILINLANTSYTSDYFDEKPISKYYDEKIASLLKASYDAQPQTGGSMYLVIAHGEKSSIIDDFIVKIVEDISKPSYFEIWKKKWDKASELGSKGVIVDVDATTEL